MLLLYIFSPKLTLYIFKVIHILIEAQKGLQRISHCLKKISKGFGHFEPQFSYEQKKSVIRTSLEIRNY